MISLTFSHSIEKIIKNERVPLFLVVLLGLFILSSLGHMIMVFSRETTEIKLTHDHPLILPTVVDISSLHLFGHYDQRLADLPQTQLQLALQGIAMGVIDNGGSRALIAAPNQPTKVYKIGDVVPGGAIIRQILRDRVILDDNGRFESLNLPVPEIAGTVARIH